MTSTKLSLMTLIQREYDKHSQRGVGIIFGLFFGFILIKGLPLIGKIIWPWVLEFLQVHQIEKWQFLLLIVWVNNTFFYLFFNFIMWIVYHLELPFFEQYKISTEPWPWKANKDEWDKLLKKTIVIVLLNNFAIVPSLILIQFALVGTQVEHSFEIQDLPDSQTFLLQAIFCAITEDFFFTVMHRILHFPYFYKRVHKYHHQYTTTVGICAEYAHPVEFIFSNSIPFGIPCMILGRKMHVYTFLVWGIIRIADTIYGHCGYDFPWIFSEFLPFRASATYHDFHHSHNIGNYSGTFVFWDTIFDWNLDFYKKYKGQKLIQPEKLKAQ